MSLNTNIISKKKSSFRCFYFVARGVEPRPPMADNESNLYLYFSKMIFLIKILPCPDLINFSRFTASSVSKNSSTWSSDHGRYLTVKPFLLIHYAITTYLAGLK